MRLGGGGNCWGWWGEGRDCLLRQLKRYEEAAHYGRLALELFEAQGVDDPEYSEVLEDLSELDKLSD